jgi:hypothetical protein
MSKIALEPNISGTGVFTIKAPNSNTNRTLDLPDATGELQVSGQPVTFPDGSQQSSSAAMSFRNKLINGGFDVWQRATTQSTSGYGSDDRWSNQNTGSTKTNSGHFFTNGQTEVPGNPKYFCRTVVSSVAGAANYVAKKQRIEDVRTLSGKTATLSFWAKADASQSISVSFKQHFGTGGSPSADVTGIGITKIALTTSWQKYTVTVNIPSITGKTLGTDKHALYVAIWFDAGSNYNAFTDTLGHQSGTFDLAQVQLEEGSVATAFEDRPFGLELQLCQRYYERTGFIVLAALTNRFQSGYWKVQKRVSPVLTLTVVGGTAAAVSTFTEAPTTGFYQTAAHDIDSNAVVSGDAEL